MTGDRGILGALPRERPGTRSEKRAGGRPAARPRPPRARQEARAGAPASLALRVGAQAARGGLLAASRLAGGVLRRLPRP